MPTTEAYAQALTIALSKKYQNATQAAPDAFRQALASLTNGLETLVKNTQFKTLPLNDACAKIATYVSEFNYTILEEDHPDCAIEFKTYLSLIAESVKTLDTQSLDSLCK